MKRTVDLDREYRCDSAKAIEKFFKRYPEHEGWRETLEWMDETNTEHLADDVLADGTANNEWVYSLWLVKGEGYTYLAVIERA